jgi:hypothetical protein
MSLTEAKAPIYLDMLEQVHRMALTYLMNALSEQVHTGIQNLASARARLLYHETGKRGYSELK